MTIDVKHVDFTAMVTDLSHTFVTSDHHFGSYKLPSFLKTFTKEQEKELIDKWNSVVGKDDLVYYNGDFCDGNVMELCGYFKQLNGQIILIRGNHEKLDDSLYLSIFKDATDSITIPDLDLTIHHCPGARFTKYEVFGHLHRGMEYKNKLKTSFCACVQSNNGYPVSLEKIVQYFKSQTCQVDC